MATFKTEKDNGKEAPKFKASDDKRDAHAKTGDVVPPSRTDTKGETRLFQRGPEERVWLTEDEAKSEGFYWRDIKKLGPA